MSNEEFLPVPQKQTRLPTNIKEGLKKAGKITKYSLLTMGFGLATVGTMAIAPVLSIPSIIGLTYTGQKLLNNTIYKGYKDLAFVTKKSNNKVKIFQDWTRNDITRPIKNYTDIEKAGFMQLQAIIGMSKFDREDKEGRILTYSTTSHGITRKTFKKLVELGYIENYQEEYKKDSRLIIPKLAFGNTKALNEKVKMYDISFNKTDKQLDIEDPELKKAFPMVFGRRGLIQRRGYEIVPDGKGGITFKIEKNKQMNIDNRQNEENKLKHLKEGVPTYKQQAEYCKDYLARNNQEKPNLKEDKQL